MITKCDISFTYSTQTLGPRFQGICKKHLLGNLIIVSQGIEVLDSLREDHFELEILGDTHFLAVPEVLSRATNSSHFEEVSSIQCSLTYLRDFCAIEKNSGIA